MKHLDDRRHVSSLQFIGSNPKSFVFSLILFLICLSYSLSIFLNSASALSIGFSFVAIFYTIIYGMHLRKPSNLLSRLATVSFLLSIALFLGSTMLYISLSTDIPGYIFMMLYVGTYVVIFLLLFFILQLYFLSKNKKLRLIVIAAVLIATTIIFASSLVMITSDDELVIGYYGIQHLFSGINPYTQPIPGILYHSAQTNKTSVTISTNGSIIGVMDYPALYFIVQIPFYLISNTSQQYIPSGFFHYQEFAFLILLLLSYMLINGKKQTQGPDFLMLIAFSLTTLWLSSMVAYLMLALVILMYSDIAKRYSWLILGLMASLQEQLWIIVLLFIAYSFNNKGARGGLKDLLGVAAVFLLINGYFIFTAPSSYVQSFDSPLATLLPNPGSPIGYLLASIYQVPLYAYTYLFLASIALSLLISLYLNDRKLLLLLSMIPFLFLGHGSMLYYSIPITAFAMVINADAFANAKDLLARAVAKRRGVAYAFSAAIILCVSFMFVMAYASHVAYNNGLDMYSYNQSIEMTNATTLTYNVQLTYNPKNATYLYFMMGGISNGSALYYGLFNYSLIKGVHNCSFPCAVNVNKIILPSSGHYDLTAMLPSNIATPTYFFAVLSNNDYYYRTQLIRYG